MCALSWNMKSNIQISVCLMATYLFNVSTCGTQRSEVANISVIITLKSFEHLC